MTYQDMCEYIRTENLITRKITLLQQMVGNGMVRMVVRRGSKTVYLGYSPITSWHMWDLKQINDSLQMIDVWKDAIWAMRCVGFVRKTTNNDNRLCSLIDAICLT